MTFPNVYIIGGQSNAAGLLNTLAGTYNVNSYGDFNGNPLPSLPANIYGYAVGGTAISYWLNPLNNQILMDIISAHASSHPYIIWWQGERDVGSDLTTFTTNTQLLFSQFKLLAPTCTIIEVIIPNYSNNSNTTSLENVQAGLGDYQISGAGYKWYQTVHLSQQGYADFWNTLISQYPLNSAHTAKVNILQLGQIIDSNTLGRNYIEDEHQTIIVNNSITFPLTCTVEVFNWENLTDYNTHNRIYNLTTESVTVPDNSISIRQSIFNQLTSKYYGLTI